jgi:hypothetical protein
MPTPSRLGHHHLANLGQHLIVRPLSLIDEMHKDASTALPARLPTDLLIEVGGARDHPCGGARAEKWRPRQVLLPRARVIALAVPGR